MPMLTTDDELRTLLTESRTIAVVGLSEKTDRDSNLIARYLQDHSYTIIPVNPSVDRILGQKCYPTVAAIGHPVDIVDVFRRPDALPEIVEDVIRSGSKALWLQLNVIHEAAARRATEAGLAVVMDRCIAVEHRHLIGR